MRESTTINNSINTIDKIPAPVPKIKPIGAGVAQGRTYIKLFIPNTSTKNLKAQTLIIGVIKNGIKK